MVTTSFLPLRLGSAVLGRSIEPGAGAPEIIRVHGQCWQLVTDPQIAVTEQQIRGWAAQDAQEKAEAAQEEAVRLAGIAATEADEALEAVLGEMVSDKSNVFIQAIAPVAEMRKPGVLWIDTSPVAVDGAQAPGNIPKTWDPAAAQWVAVTDFAAVQAAADAADAHAAADAAAAAAGEAMAEARYGSRLADRAPTPADGVDMPDGAGWHQYGLTTNHEGVTDVRLVQTWRWDGAQWRRLDMDTTMLPAVDIGTGTFGDLSGDRLDVTGTLSARIVDAMDTATKRLIVTEDALLQRATVIEDIVTPEIAAARGYFEEIILGQGANRIPNGNLSLREHDAAGNPLNRLLAWPGLSFSIARGQEVGYDAAIWLEGRVNGRSAVFSVEPGETYFFSCWARGDRAGKRFYVQLVTNGDGASPYPVANAVTRDGEWERFEGQITLPRDATTAYVNIYGNHANGSSTAGYQWFTGFELRRASSGNLIVPGAIKARQILLTGNPDDPDEAALAASLAEIIKLKVGHLIVEDQADIEGARLVGEAFAEYLNVTGQLLVGGEGAVFTGPVAFKNLIATGDPDDPEAAAIIASLARMLRIVAGDPVGERVEIDRDGVVKYGLDPDGIQYEMVRIGPGEGDNLLTIGDTTISPAGVAAPQGDFDTLSVGGDELTTIIDRLPRGVISFMWVAGESAWHGVNENIKRIEAEATLEPGRRYRISLDSHSVQLRSASPMQYVTLLRAEMPRGSGMTNIATARYHLTGTTENQPIGQLVGWVDTIDRTTPIDAIFDYVVRGSAGRDHRISNTDSKLRLTVEDVGPALVATGTSYMDEGTPQEGSSQAPPKEDPVRRYTNVQWNAGGYGGDTSAGDVVQGYYSGVGMRSGGWVFPSAMRTALAGATIEKLEVYLYASHWYWGSGGTASIRPNNGSYQGWVGSAFTSPNWPRNHGRWVKVPSSWHSAIAAGTYRGVGVQTSSTNSLYYGRFTGSATKFRATYRK